MTDWPEGFDPFAPLVKFNGAAIHQRIGGRIFVRWADGTEEDFPVGFSVRDAEVEVTKRLERMV